MFENLSYKRKLIALGVLFVLLIIVANKRSFRATKDAYKQMKEVESQFLYMKESSYNSKQLQNQVLMYDDLIGQQDIEAYAVQQSILDFANTYSNLTIKELTETHLSSANGFEVTTNQLFLEGDFQLLTKIIYEFEKQFKTSSLVSVTFVKERDFRRRTNQLKVQLIFQNYEKSM